MGPVLKGDDDPKTRLAYLVLLGVNPSVAGSCSARVSERECNGGRHWVHLEKQLFTPNLHCMLMFLQLMRLYK